MRYLQKYYKELLWGLVFILLLGIYALFFYFNFFYEKKEVINVPIYNEESNDQENDKQVEDIKEDIALFAEIKGEVKKPGVYAITKKTIVNDLVTLAGGFKNTAYTRNINLSKKVSDQMVILVYSKSEYNALNEPKILYIEKDCKCPEYDISSCITNGSSVIENGKDESDNQENNNLVNINLATKEQLMTLSGIGESKAQSIIDYRKENGPFKQIEDITLVSGISEKTFASIKEYLTI